MKSWIKLTLIFVLVSAVAVTAGAIFIVARWDTKYLRCLDAAKADYKGYHAGFGSASGLKYLTFDINFGDTEPVVDLKLARGLRSTHMTDKRSAIAHGFTVHFDMNYGPQFTNPDGTSNWLIIETIDVDFNEEGQAFYIHQSLFRPDESSGAYDIDLKTGDVRYY